MKKYFELFSKYKWRIIAVILIIVLAVCAFNLLNQSEIDVTFYQVRSDKVSDNIRIVVLADLHLKEFGKDNIRLVEQIDKLTPDIIACVGDMNNLKNDDYSVVTNLCEKLVNIAPVYYALGNNEYEAKLFKDSNITKDLKAVGVHVLDDASEIVDIKDTKLNIGGLSQGPEQFERYGHQFFDKYIEEDYFKLLLVHYPDEFMGILEDYPIDLALCGHAHGGQVRIPFVGGLYATGQGFFPKLVDGFHQIGNSNVIISRGLGSSAGQTAHAQRHVQGQGTGGDHIHLQIILVAKTHNGALAVHFLDLAHSSLNGPLLVLRRRGGGNRRFLFCHTFFLPILIFYLNARFGPFYSL